MSVDLEEPLCLYPDCPYPTHARGLCMAHYARGKDQRWFDVQGLEENCQVPECGRGVYAKGLCRNHYNQGKRRAKQGDQGPLRPTLEQSYEKMVEGTCATPNCPNSRRVRSPFCYRCWQRHHNGVMQPGEPVPFKGNIAQPGERVCATPGCVRRCGQSIKLCWGCYARKRRQGKAREEENAAH